MIQLPVRSLNAAETREPYTATAAARLDRLSPAFQCFRSSLREPLLHFMVLGFLIWGGLRYWSVADNRYTIDLGSTERDRIARTYLRQFGQFPTPRQLQSLLDRYIRDEIFVREALDLGLDKDDEIVRRRLIQKYEFLESDISVPERPDADVLQHWFEHERSRYETPERVTFKHLYFSRDSAGDNNAKLRAQKLLQELRTQTARLVDPGDPFPGPPHLGVLSAEGATRLFGQSELSDRLFSVPVGYWAGPYKSSYGWHLIYVEGHIPAALPRFSQIRERVLEDYLQEQQHVMNARAFQTLRAKYTVRTDRGP